MPLEGFKEDDDDGGRFISNLVIKYASLYLDRRSDGDETPLVICCFDVGLIFQGFILDISKISSI